MAVPVRPALRSSVLDVLLNLGRERLKHRLRGLGVRLFILLVVSQRWRDTREEANCSRDLFDHCFRLVAKTARVRVQ